MTIAVDKISLLAESQAVEIVHQISPNLLVAVDPLRIQRVLVNLFVNALEAMPNGGTIRVSAVGERESVLIKVRDTGPGITPEIRERLFEPFATSGRRADWGWDWLFRGRPYAIMAARCGWSSRIMAHVLPFGCPRLGKRAQSYTDTDWPWPKTRRIGGAVRNDSRKGSPGLKESAIFKIACWDRALCWSALD